MLSTLLSCLVPALVAPAAVETEVVWLRATSVQSFRDLALADPEHEFNCDEVRLPRTDLRVILPVETIADEMRSADLRGLAKLAIREAVLDGSGLLHQRFLSGELGGLELSWFNALDAAVPAGSLPGFSELRDPATSDLLARIYTFDGQGYQQRLDQLGEMIGHPVNSYPVWMNGPVLNDASGPRVLYMQGDSNAIHGDVCSTTDVWIWGTPQLGGGVAIAGNLHLMFSQLNPPAVPFFDAALSEAPLTIDEARLAAQESGVYSSRKLVIDDDNLPPSGSVVFSERMIRVDCTGVEASWTLVSAGGRIEVWGCDNRLSAALGDCLLLAGDDVSVIGGGNRLVGESRSLERVYVGGYGNTLVGPVVGAGMTLMGLGNVVSDGTHPTPPY